MKLLIVFRALKVLKFIVGWYKRANEDGKVTKKEVVQLIQGIAERALLAQDFKVE